MSPRCFNPSVVLLQDLLDLSFLGHPYTSNIILYMYCILNLCKSISLVDEWMDGWIGNPDISHHSSHALMAANLGPGFAGQLCVGAGGNVRPFL